MKRLSIIVMLISFLLLGSITIDAKTSTQKKSKTRTTKTVGSNVAIVGKFTAHDRIYTMLANGKIKSPKGRIIGKYEKKGDGSYYEIVMDEGDWYVIYMIVGNKVYAVGGGTDGIGIEDFSYNPSDNTVSVVNTTDLDDKEFLEYNEISSLRAPLSEFNEIGTVKWQ